MGNRKSRKCTGVGGEAHEDGHRGGGHLRLVGCRRDRRLQVGRGFVQPPAEVRNYLVACPTK